MNKIDKVSMGFFLPEVTVKNENKTSKSKAADRNKRRREVQRRNKNRTEEKPWIINLLVQVKCPFLCSWYCGYIYTHKVAIQRLATIYITFVDFIDLQPNAFTIIFTNIFISEANRKRCTSSQYTGVQTISFYIVTDPCSMCEWITFLFINTS